ncbi:MAG: hypothetical protein K9N07_07650 [Candidatus Cloacimonetes bacterium]|nr:hypothetical protein [Candidatus Cloacimonadota bacterium]MCF8012798.1 hypothetical protein [Candidatus Woesearchaeota archaeon]
MEINTEDFDKIVDLDLGIDVTLRRKTTTVDPDYGSLISDSNQDTIIKVVWQEITGEEENFRPEGGFNIGDIKCFTKSSYENGTLIIDSKTDTILKGGVEHKILKNTNHTVGDTVVYKVLHLRLK